jgi:hypothetical protein
MQRIVKDRHAKLQAAEFVTASTAKCHDRQELQVLQITTPNRASFDLAAGNRMAVADCR